MAVLEVLSEDLAGRSYRIDQQRFTIGRHSENNLVLPKRFISRCHAEILTRGNRFVLRGLSKKNPLIHRNEEKHSVELKHGEVFEICGIRFRFNGARSATGQFAGQDNVRFSGSQPGMAAAGVAAGAAASPEADGFDSFENDDWGDADGWSEETDPQDGFGDDFAAGDQNDDFGQPQPEPAQQLSGLGAGDEDWMNVQSAEASRERFVFGDDDGEKVQNKGFDDDEKTELVNLNDSNEQTGQIDLLNLDANLDDPFAGEDKSEEEQVIFKVLISICLCALVVAAIILFMTIQPEQASQRKEIAFTVSPGQVRKFEFNFTSDDKPNAVSFNGEWKGLNLNYAWILLHEDQFVQVLWMLPSKYSGFGQLLIEGKNLNPTGSVYTLRFARKGDWRNYRVKVVGKSVGEDEKQRFLEETIKKSKGAIKTEIKNITSKGDGYWAEVDNGFPEFYKQALNDYRRAAIALEALKKKVGTNFDPDIKRLNTLVTGKIANAEKQWNEQVTLQIETYKRVTQQNGGKAARITELRKLLKVIQDKDSLRYKAYKMLLESIESS